MSVEAIVLLIIAVLGSVFGYTKGRRDAANKDRKDRQVAIKKAKKVREKINEKSTDDLYSDATQWVRDKKR